MLRLISSRDGEAVQVHRMANAAKSKFKYELDPDQQLAIFKEIDDADLELGMIYHSHTRSDPSRPRPTSTSRSSATATAPRSRARCT